MIRISSIPFTAVILLPALAFVPSAMAQGPAREAVLVKALAIPNGSPVAVETGSGVVRGILETLNEQGVTLRVIENNRFLSRAIPFNEVRGIRKTGKPKVGVSGLSGSLGAGGSLEQSLDGIPIGAPVTVSLPDKSTVSGRYAGRTGNGVNVQTPEPGGKMGVRTIPFDQFAGIKQPKGKLPGMPAMQSTAMIRKSLSGIPIGSPVNLNMPGGSLLSGKLMGLDAKGLSLQTVEGPSLVTKQLAFDQVASVKMPKPGVRGMIPGLRKPGLQTPEAIKAKALNLQVGSPMTVRMPDGNQFSGKFMGATNDGIQVQGLQGGNLVTRTLAYDAVGSIKPGVPVTPAGRAKGFARVAATTLVTAAVAGYLSGVISK